MVFVHLVLRLLWLVFQLTRKTCILNHCQLGRAHELVFIHIKHFDLNGSDLQQHVFPEFVDLHDLVMLDLLEFCLVLHSLQISFCFPVVSFCDEGVLIFFKCVVVVHLSLHLCNDRI